MQPPPREDFPASDTKQTAHIMLRANELKKAASRVTKETSSTFCSLFRSATRVNPPTWDSAQRIIKLP
jgi:hypothetical protein